VTPGVGLRGPCLYPGSPPATDREQGVAQPSRSVAAGLAPLIGRAASRGLGARADGPTPAPRGCELSWSVPSPYSLLIPWRQPVAVGAHSRRLAAFHARLGSAAQGIASQPAPPQPPVWRRGSACADSSPRLHLPGPVCLPNTKLRRRFVVSAPEETPVFGDIKLLPPLHRLVARPAARLRVRRVVLFAGVLVAGWWVARGRGRRVRRPVGGRGHRARACGKPARGQPRRWSTSWVTGDPAICRAQRRGGRPRSPASSAPGTAAASRPR
jgi:hypothetical protein